MRRGTGHTPVSDAYILSPVAAVGTLPAGKAVDITYVGTITGQTGPGLVASLVNTATASYSTGSATSAAEVTAIDSLTLSDRVFLDANKNGVFDAGEGLAGVSLTLFADTNGNGVYDDGADLAISYIGNNNNGVFDPAVDTPAAAGTAGAIALTVTSGANGVYSFGNLAAGDYIVRVNGSNFTGAGALVGRRAVSATSDPDNSTDDDSNATQFLAGQAGTYAASQAITLSYDQEPAPGTGNDTNNTLDLGFIQPNQAPTITGLQGDTVTYTEDTNTSVRVDLGLNAVVSDSDSTNFNGGSLTASITSGFVAARDRIGIFSDSVVTVSGNNVSVNGLLIGTVTGNSTTGTPTLVLTFTTDDATPAAVQAVIQHLFYGNGFQDPVAGTRGITVTLVDGDGTADGGADTSTYTTSVNVVAVNDAPVNTVPGAQTTAEDTARVFSSGNNNAISISNVDAGTGNVQVTICVANGALTLSRTTGLTFTTGDGTADASMTFSGTVANVNAALNGLSYTPTLNYNGTDTLTITTSDLGNSGNGGALTDTDMVGITVTAVNDAPGGANSTVTINEDATRTLSAADFGFTDVDGDAFGGVRFTSAPTGGTLYYAPAGQAPVVASLNTTYSAADVAAGYLTFVPTTNLNGNGAASITFAVVDNGSPALTDPSPNTLTINLTPVNDPPSLTGLSLSATFAENTVNATPQLIDSDVTLTDAEGNFASGSVTISGLLAEDRVAIRDQGMGAGQIGVSAGNVTFGGTVIGTFSGGSGNALTVALNGAATTASIEALIENLTYQNVSNTPTPSRVLTLAIVGGAGGQVAGGAASFTQLTGAANPFGAINVASFPGPSFFDVDGDGDRDLVSGLSNGTLRTFRYDGISTPVTELAGASNPFNGIDAGDVSDPSFVDLDGDGALDLVIGTYGGNVVSYRNNGIGNAFTQLIGAANPFASVAVGATASPTFVDLDGDGDRDAVIGSQGGTTFVYRNDGPGNPWVQLTGAANPFNGITGFDVRWAFVDLDGDGDLDAIMGSNGIIRAFRNNGTGAAFTELTGAANPFNGVNLGGSLISPASVDLDGDGDLDMVFARADGTFFRLPEQFGRAGHHRQCHAGE